MDLQFVSKLQTALTTFGRGGEFAPVKSQDPANKILHEYFVAETARSMFDKRRKAALEALKSLDTKGVVAAELEQVKESGIGSSVALVDTEHFTCVLTLKAPTQSLDEALLRVELVKAGLSANKIEKAFENSRKKNKPAETYNVSLKRT